MNDSFIFNWVLKNKLCIGTCPSRKGDVNILKKNKIKYIVGLCSQKEAEWHESLECNFVCKRIKLPDSNQNRLPSFFEINNAYSVMKDFLKKGITFVHCFASIERSPLLCILFVMEEYNLSLEEALDYLKKVHKTTNPRNNQLLLIQNFKLKNT